jgi:hypothetical protein
MGVFLYADRKWAMVLLIDSLAAIALSFIPGPPLLKNPGTLPSILGGLEIDSISAITADSLTSSRLSIWKTTLSELDAIERLWTGVGGNGFARLQVLYGVAIKPGGHVHAHNVVIQGICDWGITGVLLLGAFVYQSMLKPIVADRKLNDPTALGGIVFLLVTGMLDASLYHLEFLTYLAIAMAYLIARKPASRTAQIVFPTPLVIAVMLALAMIHTQTQDYRIGLSWYFPTR